MNNNNAGKNFLLLLLGLGMLGGGLVLFFSQVQLRTVGYSFWGFIGNRNVTGVLFIPLILGIVLWILFSKSIWPKILTWVSVVAMILCVISSLRFEFHADGFTTIMYIILIFGGGALTLKKLYIDSPGRGRNKEDNNEEYKLK